MTKTPDTLHRALELARTGRTMRDIAALLGVTFSALESWVQRGRRGDTSELAAWAIEWDRARADFKSRIEDVVVNSALASADERVALDAGKFVLERRYSRDWGQKVEHHVAQALDRIFEVLKEELSEADYERITLRLSGIGSAQGLPETV